MTNKKTAKLILENKELELDIITGSENESAIDITSLRNKTGYITIDPGYANTGSCISDITFINGETGILRYRGYPIEELANNVSFTDVAYLLLHGNLPTPDEKNIFSKSLRNQANIHEDMKRFFDGFPINAHPMATLSSMVTALSTFNPSVENDELNMDDTIIKLFLLSRKLFETKTFDIYHFFNERTRYKFYYRS